jgi:uncharacterized protein (DUF1501 family)
MHTGYVPNPNIEHPSYGAVISRELVSQVPDLEIPPFVAVGAGSVGPGFLGMTYAPFVVSADGNVKNLKMGVNQQRMMERMNMLATLEKGFIQRVSGERLTAKGGTANSAADHAKVLNKTLTLLTSKQMEAFKVDKEPSAVRERYGKGSFADGCIMARRLVEQGVPFVEVDFGGWDTHKDNFDSLATDKLPQLDKAMSALVEDLEQRGLLQDTAIIWMGEFGRTPAINGDAGRDHWARSWSVVLGGAGMKGGVAIGATDSNGANVETEPYASQDVMASVCKALGISLETTYTSNNGRPMKIANSGKVIKELFA